MIRFAMVLAFCAASALATRAAPALKAPKNQDNTLIVGLWAQESMSSHGAPAQPRQGTFRFGKDGTSGIANNGPETPATYTLDTSRSPAQMKWLHGPQMKEWLCLYKIDGDRLMVAFVDHGTEPPKTIEPAANLTIYYLKRIKD